MREWERTDAGWSLGPRPSVDPLVAILDVLVWLLCAAFAGAVAFSYLMAVTP